MKIHAISNSPLLGRDHARVLSAGVRAFRGPFAAVSTLPYIHVLFDFDTLFGIFRDIFDSVPHFFMIFVFSSIHRGRTRQLYRFRFFPLSADVHQFPQRAARATASVFFFLGIPSHYLGFPEISSNYLLVCAPHA